MALRSPADLGYETTGSRCRRSNVDVVTVDADARLGGSPVRGAGVDAAERRQARRESLPQRVELAAEIVNATTGRASSGAT
jgi:hypothetical protein